LFCENEKLLDFSKKSSYQRFKTLDLLGLEVTFDLTLTIIQAPGLYIWVPQLDPIYFFEKYGKYDEVY